MAQSAIDAEARHFRASCNDAEQRGGAKAAEAAEAAAGAQGEADGAEQRGAKRGEASAEQRGDAKAAAAAEAEAEARGEGDGAEQRGAQRGKASAEQRGNAKAAEAAADARDEGEGTEQRSTKRSEASAAPSGMALGCCHRCAGAGAVQTKAGPRPIEWACHRLVHPKCSGIAEDGWLFIGMWLDAWTSHAVDIPKQRVAGCSWKLYQLSPERLSVPAGRPDGVHARRTV